MTTSNIVTISAPKLRNSTGIRIDSGGQYRFAASGTWMDADIACGPGGYRSPNILFDLVAPFRRFPRARWFELIGAFDANIDSTFRIGAGRVLTATRSGQLTGFANDIGFLYGNNSGSIQLTVTRLN